MLKIYIYFLIFFLRIYSIRLAKKGVHLTASSFITDLSKTRAFYTVLSVYSINESGESHREEFSLDDEIGSFLTKSQYVSTIGSIPSAQRCDRCPPICVVSFIEYRDSKKQHFI